MTSGAIIEDEFRYVLWRYLGSGGPAGTVLWVMLNPSTADAVADDATIRKVMGFSRRWGFAWARVVNLYALRSRDPKALKTHPAPIGPKNDEHIAREVAQADGVVLAWGANAEPVRSLAVRRLVHQHAAAPIWRLGTTSCGEPGHPLMISYKMPRIADVLPGEPG